MRFMYASRRHQPLCLPVLVFNAQRQDDACAEYTLSTMPQVMMLGGRRKSRRERRLEAAEALEDAREEDGVFATDLADMPTSTADQDSVEPLPRTAIERGQPKLHHSRRKSAALAAEERHTATLGSSLGQSGRHRNPAKPLQWSDSPADTLNSPFASSDRPAATMQGADIRRDAVRASSASPSSEGAITDAQPGMRPALRPEVSSPVASVQAGPATAAGRTFASWWQSLSALNPNKQVQPQRRVKA